MTPNHYIQMAQNNAWANSTVYEVLNSLGCDEFWGPRPGFFGSVGRTMNHIYEVDLFYVDALTEGGKGREVYNREDIVNPRELSARQHETDMEFISYCAGLTCAKLARTVATQRDDETVLERVDRLILHLVQHQIHHRGQAHAMLSHAGINPPQLDDFYLEYRRAPTARPYFDD